MRALPITGEYPPDWPQIGDRVRAEAGHRCIRCKHPYLVGKSGTGEWSQCDEHCEHSGPIAVLRPWITEPATSENLSRLAPTPANLAAAGGMRIFAEWRILTVHHLDGDKANCVWWNLLALCQRCHLQIQARVNPNNPYFLEHSKWFEPYVAGFYAKRYEGKEITREEAVARRDELLAYERLA